MLSGGDIIFRGTIKTVTLVLLVSKETDPSLWWRFILPTDEGLVSSVKTLKLTNT